MMVSIYEMRRADDRRPYVEKVNETECPAYAGTLSGPDDVYRLMEDAYKLSRYAEEHLYVIAADTKCHVIGVSEVAHGTVNACPVTPREILLRALLLGASAFFLVHNHPSGSPVPSDPDIDLTRRVQEAADIIGLRFLDHVIAGEHGSYVSFLQSQISERGEA